MTNKEITDVYILALCVWREARGESPMGKRLVATVIRNRVDDYRWPSTYTGVVTQARQFSSFNIGDPNSSKFPLDVDQFWNDCLEAAKDVYFRAEAPLTTANHYHVKDMQPLPTWSDVNKIVAREGHHVFYEL